MIRAWFKQISCREESVLRCVGSKNNKNIRLFTMRGWPIGWARWSKDLDAFLVNEVVEYYVSRVVCTAAPAVMLGVVVTTYDEIMAKYTKIINIILNVHIMSWWTIYCSYCGWYVIEMD